MSELRTTPAPDVGYLWDVWDGDTCIGQVKHWADDHLWQVTRADLPDRRVEITHPTLFGSRDLAVRALAALVREGTSE